MCSRVACSRTSFPPPAQWQSITPQQARELFRRVFKRWGLPKGIQVDNGHPWGVNRGLAPDLALWLIGLGVTVSWIPPGQAQKNGKIERGNGVMQQWADPSQCRNRGQMQKRLDQECLIQRESYPSIEESRMAAYPELKHSGRPYDVAQENELWDLARVDRFLAAGVYYRRANARGAIWLYGRGRVLGRAYRGMEVSVRFDPTPRLWVASDHQGEELKRLPADELSRDRIMALDVGHKRSGKRNPKTG
jgi:hypothetical protein